MPSHIHRVRWSKGLWRRINLFVTDDHQRFVRFKNRSSSSSENITPTDVIDVAGFPTYAIRKNKRNHARKPYTGIVYVPKPKDRASPNRGGIEHPHAAWHIVQAAWHDRHGFPLKKEGVLSSLSDFASDFFPSSRKMKNSPFTSYERIRSYVQRKPDVDARDTAWISNSLFSTFTGSNPRRAYLNACIRLFRTPALASALTTLNSESYKWPEGKDLRPALLRVIDFFERQASKTQKA